MGALYCFRGAWVERRDARGCEVGVGDDGSVEGIEDALWGGDCEGFGEEWVC